jgi:hypothetical protein
MTADERALVVHALVIKGFASTDALATVTGLPTVRVQQQLESLGKDGLAKLREGRLSGWAPTAEAKQLHQELLAGPLAPKNRTQLLDAYQQFSVLNGEFKELCTRWQLRNGPSGSLVPNDHTDPAYDQAVVNALAGLDQRVAQLLAQMVPLLGRADGYRGRLTDAVDRLRQGEQDRFTKPLSDSYHDIWMELHQDLILTLGLQRTAADA